MKIHIITLSIFNFNEEKFIQKYLDKGWILVSVILHSITNEIKYYFLEK